MLAENTVLICPICKTATKSDGSKFTGLRSITLHVAGKAKGLNDLHRAWVYKLVSGVDVKSASINQIGDQIEFYVWEALQELERPETTQDGLTEQTFDSIETNFPTGRSDTEREQYITAYKFIWTIETRLHRFVADVLSHSKEGPWWTSFPNDLQKKCLERAQQDNHRSPRGELGCYIDLLDFGGIIKHNKDVFSDAFDRLMKEYKDPRAEFHSKLVRINDLRNLVMHPVRQVAPSHDDLAMLERFSEFVNIFVNDE